jgi:dCMP deaminase
MHPGQSRKPCPDTAALRNAGPLGAALKQSAPFSEIDNIKEVFYMTRRDKANYYLDIAETVAERGTCLRRNFGAIIVKNDQIVSTGYVGAPRGRENCSDLGYCTREKLNIPRGQRYELCRSVHAEMNAIIHASRVDMLGATLYLVGREVSDGSYVQNASPCSMCARLIINAGISTVVVRDTRDAYRVYDVNEAWVEQDESLSGLSNY